MIISNMKFKLKKERFRRIESMNALFGFLLCRFRTYLLLIVLFKKLIMSWTAIYIKYYRINIFLNLDAEIGIV